MSCCDENLASVPKGIHSTKDVAAPDVSRRSVLKGAAAIAGVLSSAGPVAAQTNLKPVKLAYCSQILCGVPYEVARSAGYWRNQGLDVELIYTRGGSAAMQALIGGAVDYAATALDVAIQAYSKGAEIKRFAVTGRLPLFALVTAPKTSAAIKTVKDLEGKTVGVSALGNADHALLLFLLKQANADTNKVQFATLGVNLLEALRQGQVEAGLVQEPALSILQKDGARVIVNAMDTNDAKKYLGGAYEFMGVSVRAKEFDQRRADMTGIVKGLAEALKGLRTMSGDQLVSAFPKELTSGLDSKQLGDILVRYRNALYPETVTIDRDAIKRVANSLEVGGLLKAGTDLAGLHDTSIAGG
jgi:NitT/TauT family transport system substrate-binding protein